MTVSGSNRSSGTSSAWAASWKHFERRLLFRRPWQDSADSRRAQCISNQQQQASLLNQEAFTRAAEQFQSQSLTPKDWLTEVTGWQLHVGLDEQFPERHYNSRKRGSMWSMSKAGWSCEWTRNRGPNTRRRWAASKWGIKSEILTGVGRRGFAGSSLCRLLTSKTVWGRELLAGAGWWERVVSGVMAAETQAGGWSTLAGSLGQSVWCLKTPDVSRIRHRRVTLDLMGLSVMV